MRLSHRFALIFSIFGAAIAAGFQYTQIREARAQMRARVESTADTASRAVTALVEAQMKSGRPMELGRHFMDLLRHTGLASIVVKDKKGRRLVGRSDQSAAKRQAHPGIALSEVADSYFDVESPVDLGQKGWGVVQMSFYTGGLDEDLRRREIEGIRVGFMAFLAITVAAWLLGTWLGSAIERLVPSLEALPKDPERFRPLRHRSAVGEVSRLVAAFNAMGSSLKAETLRRRTLEAEKRELSAMLVHDLKTPLTVIYSGITLLQDQLADGAAAKDGEASRRRTFELLNLSTKRLHRMVEDVLQLSRMEEVSGLREKKPVDLAELARACARDMELVAADRGLKLAVSAPEGLPAVEGDGALLRRVLDNLVHNAIEHSPSKGSVRIDVEPEEPGRVRVNVSDCGPGIPPEARADIFKKFFQRDFKPHVGNVGLGLALCQKVVERHDGTIGVTEARPRGARFYFVLPALQQAPDQA